MIKKVYLALLSASLLVSTNPHIAAQETREDLQGELAAVYGFYRLGEICLAQGFSFTKDSLASVQSAAEELEGKLGDEQLEAQIWSDSAEGLGFMTALITQDAVNGRAQCAQVAAIANAIQTPSAQQKPF